PVGKPVELEDILAYVEVRLDRDLVSGIAFANCGRRGVDEVADPADVEHQPFRRVRDGLPPEARDHGRSVRTGTDVPSRARRVSLWSSETWSSGREPFDAGMPSSS